MVQERTDEGQNGISNAGLKQANPASQKASGTRGPDRIATANGDSGEIAKSTQTEQ